jgi:N-formylglutamate amidohydrolase
MNNHYLVHLPHCGTYIPNEYKKDYYLSAEELHKNIYEYADLYTDELYESIYKEFGGVKSNYSRLFIDPERFFDDSQENMKKYGLGWFYEKAIIEEKPLRSIVCKKEVSKYYKQHHKELTQKTKEKLKRYNQCTIIDCHSFSNHRYWFQPHDKEFPDICIGYDEPHKDQKVIDIIIEVFEGYDIGINTPYSGSLVPMEYYEKNYNVRSVMIEINKRLYLKSNNVVKNDNFDRIKQKITNIGNKLKQIR